MTKQVKLRRGNTIANKMFIGALAELTIDTEAKRIRLHDAVTPGGLVIGDGAQTNLLSNPNFYQESPDPTVVAPPIGGLAYAAGQQVFLHWFVSAGDATGLSRDPNTGTINIVTGSIYHDVPKTGPLGEYTGSLVTSWGDNAGLPTEDGAIINVVDMTTFYRVTLTPNGCFSAKLEQGVVASRHDAGRATEKEVISPEDLELILWAHRGFASSGLQNTMMTFSRVKSQGTKYIELDIQPSIDGTLYVFHDTAVDALTDGTGTFSALTDVYIDTLKYTTTIGTKYESERIVKLVDFLPFADTNGYHLQIELKYVWSLAQLQSFIDLLQVNNFNNKKCIAAKAYIVDLQTLRSLSSDVSLGYVGSGTLLSATAFIDQLSVIGNSHLIWNQHNLLTDDFVGYCYPLGVNIAAFTITTKDQMDALIAIGVYNIISDVPFLNEVGQ